MKKRAGIYYWAGPGTVRITSLKYPGSTIDEHSFMNAYSQPNISRLNDIFGITDAWVTYSWGFSEQTEQVDYAFLQKSLPAFHKASVATHAYVQGLNLVYQEHADIDYYCRNHRGELIPYHRGRKVMCPLNPNTVNYIATKIKDACQLDVNGVFIDNMHFGQFPLMVANGKITFFGCNCVYCNNAFRVKTGCAIPSSWTIKDPLLQQYLAFRTSVMTHFTRQLSEVARSYNKQFGTNSFDPKFNTPFFFGTDLLEISKLQDYVLFENHDLPSIRRKGKNNLHIQSLVESISKPIFVVSYNKGIGREHQFSQHDYNAIYTESEQVGYAPCYKGTEFFTRNKWHMIKTDHLHPVQTITLPPKKRIDKKIPAIAGRWLFPLYNRYYTPFVTSLFEKKVIRKSFNWLYYKAMQ